MHIVSCAYFVLAFFNLATALPAADSGRAKFKVVAETKAGNGRFNGLSLTTYHTGAGLNAPVFDSIGSKFTLNQTYLQTNSGRSAFQLNFVPIQDLYAGWGSLTLNIGDGHRGFAIRKGVITFIGKTHSFTGWRICKWVHQVPELFYDVLPRSSINDTYTCEGVRLLAVAV